MINFNYISLIVVVISGIVAIIKGIIEIIEKLSKGKALLSRIRPPWFSRIPLWLRVAAGIICVLALVALFQGWRLWNYGHLVLGPEIKSIIIDGKPEDSRRIKLRSGRSYSIEYTTTNNITQIVDITIEKHRGEILLP